MLSRYNYVIFKKLCLLNINAIALVIKKRSVGQVTMDLIVFIQDNSKYIFVIVPPADIYFLQITLQFDTIVNVYKPHLMIQYSLQAIEHSSGSNTFTNICLQSNIIQTDDT